MAEVAIVTGAASGMGRATAELFAKHDWTVVGVDVARNALEELAGRLPDRLVPVVADVTDRTAVDRAAQVAAGTGEVRACVNAAGVFPPTSLEDYDLERYRRIFDINVLGIVNLTAAAAPLMRRAGGGAIVNFASVDAFEACPDQLLYSASKAAVVSLTKSTALALASSGVTANAVAPGWVDTPGNRATGRMVGVEASIPVGRVAAPEEIADVVWYLSGERRAPYLTGETIVVSGGLVMR
jgi:3-oxoacyl-[acyl-carrier protein] reductase